MDVQMSANNAFSLLSRRIFYRCQISEEEEMEQRSGFMMKQGGRVKSWKRRYFVLKDDVLSYYRDVKEQTPLGQIFFDEYWSTEPTSLQRHPFAFELRSAAAVLKHSKDGDKSKHTRSGDRIQFKKEPMEERVFVCSCASEEERVNWLRDLDAAIQQMRSRRVTETERGRVMRYQEAQADSSDSDENMIVNEAFARPMAPAAEELVEEPSPKRAPSAPAIRITRPTLERNQPNAVDSDEDL